VGDEVEDGVDTERRQGVRPLLPHPLHLAHRDRRQAAQGVPVRGRGAHSMLMRSGGLCAIHLCIIRGYPGPFSAELSVERSLLDETSQGTPAEGERLPLDSRPVAQIGVGGEDRVLGVVQRDDRTLGRYRHHPPALVPAVQRQRQG